MIRKFLPSVMLLLVTVSVAPAMEVGEPMKDMGTLRELESGLRLQLFVTDNKVHACFIDTEDLVAEVPVESILFIVDEPGHKSDEWRSVLVPGEDACLVAPRALYGPYHYRTRIIIRYQDGTAQSMANVLVTLDRNVEEALQES